MGEAGGRGPHTTISTLFSFKFFLKIKIISINEWYGREKGERVEREVWGEDRINDPICEL